MSYKEKVNAIDFRQLRKEMALLRGKLDASNKTIASLRLKQQEAHVRAAAERRRHEAEMRKELKLIRKQLEASSKRALRRQLRGMRELQSAVDDLMKADAKAKGQQSNKTRIKWLAIEDENTATVDEGQVENEQEGTHGKDEQPLLKHEKDSAPYYVYGTLTREDARVHFSRRGKCLTCCHRLTHPP